MFLIIIILVMKYMNSLKLFREHTRRNFIITKLHLILAISEIALIWVNYDITFAMLKYFWFAMLFLNFYQCLQIDLNYSHVSNSDITGFTITITITTSTTIIIIIIISLLLTIFYNICIIILGREFMEIRTCSCG